ncbi:MAG: methylated-DNA--[protein]-cysteine S-methyltransferase [Firmicutes bacterium]|nr:methylated-DNA--[protein]-cysteine S-methyltransferase [Bacillota bacterium]
MSVTVASPVGPLVIRGTERGVQAIRLGGEGQVPIQKGPVRAAEPGDINGPVPIRDAVSQLAEYFEGRRRQFDFPLDLEGTPFQRAVWACLQTIPFGETRSYGWVARAIGRPGAARAVGLAAGRNPAAIVVPCHRVIASDGSLGGYTGGLHIKRFLLQLEGLAK